MRLNVGIAIPHDDFWSRPVVNSFIVIKLETKFFIFAYIYLYLYVYTYMCTYIIYKLNHNVL